MLAGSKQRGLEKWVLLGVGGKDGPKKKRRQKGRKKEKKGVE